MKIALAGGLALVVAFVLVFGTQGGEQKEVTLKGEIQCAKCSLHLKEVSKCTTAIQVKEGSKTTTYLFDDKGSGESYHEPVCGGEKQMGTVTGTVAEKDGNKWIKPKKVEYTKK